MLKYDRLQLGRVVLCCLSLVIVPLSLTAQTHALHSGDEPLLVYQRTGCPVVVVRDGYNHGTPADELGADAVIESFSDLV